MGKTYKADKVSAEEVIKDLKEEDEIEESKWITVGTVNKDTPREEVSKIISKAIKMARELAGKQHNETKEKR